MKKVFLTSVLVAAMSISLNVLANDDHKKAEHHDAKAAHKAPKN